MALARPHTAPAFPRAGWFAGVVLGLAMALLPTAASADHVTPARVSGETRYHTAAAVAELTYTDASVAHVVTGQDFPDALAASYAVGRMDGPLLLVTRDTVPEPTWRALDVIGVDRVVLIGGTASISAAVQAELQARGYETDRIQGVNRYQTASSVAMVYGHGETGHVGTLEGRGRTAMLASGVSFPDALAAGPVAAAMHFPLFLTPPDSTEVSVNMSLQQLEIDHLLVVGGTSAVSPAVVEHYRGQGYTVERLSGGTRTDTARAVANFERTRLGWPMPLQLLARGDDYPDALAASIHAATREAPILLTADPDRLSDPSAIWLQSSCPQTNAIRALGGTAAVSTATLDTAVTAANDCEHGGSPDARQTFGVSPQEPVRHAPGSTHEFGVFARYDDQPFTGPVDIALFGCDDVDALEDPVEFRDADDDGHADGFASTDTDAARIVSVNGDAVSAQVVRDAEPADDVLRFHLRSETADCAVPVVFDDADDDGMLDVDETAHATEAFGVAMIRWTEG